MSDFTTYRWWSFYYVRVPTPSSCDCKSEQSSADTRENKHEPSLSNLCFHLHFFVIFKAMSNIDKNSHCSTDNQNVSCFCGNSVYCAWCGVYQQKCWNESRKGTTRHQRKFIFRNFDFVFLHEKFLLISNLPLCFFI